MFVPEAGVKEEEKERNLHKSTLQQNEGRRMNETRGGSSSQLQESEQQKEATKRSKRSL